MKYKLSICIPSYNNILAIKKMVKGFIEGKFPSVQMVISDDASSDGTSEWLKSLNYEHLKIIINKNNIGAHQNWNKVLNEADGGYLYLSMGRDFLNFARMDRLIELIDFFENNNIKVGMERKYKGIFQKMTKREAIAFMIGFHHPTGLIIERNAFLSVQNKTDIFNQKGDYPENYLKQKLISMFEAGVGYAGFFTDTEIINLSTIRSNVEKNTSVEKTYFYPNRRIKEVVEMIRTTREDAKELLSINEWLSVFEEMLSNGFLAILMYRSFCERYDYMQHYGFEKILVTNEEIKSFADNLVNEITKVKLSDDEILITDKCRRTFDKIVEGELYEKNIFRAKSKLKILCQCLKLCNSKILCDYFNNNGLKKIVIYGYGEVGHALADLLDNSGVEVLFAMDANYLDIYDKIDILSPETDVSYADMVIISLIDNVDMIKEKMQKKCKNIVSVEELFNKLVLY